MYKVSETHFDVLTKTQTLWCNRVCSSGLILFLLIVAYSVASSRFLYADGSAFFLGLLESQTFEFGGRPARFVADIATQWPLLAAIAVGVDSLTVLKLIYGSSLFAGYVVCVIVWWKATANNKQYLIFLVAFLFFSALNSSFFIVSESHFAAAVFFAQIPLLTLDRVAGWRWFVMLSILAALSIGSYETMVAYAPILSILAFLKMCEEDHSARRFFMCLSVWYLVVFLYAMKEVLFPIDPVNYSSSGFVEGLFDHLFNQVFGFLQFNSSLHFSSLVSISAGVLIVVAFVVGHTRSGQVRFLILGFGVLTTSLLVLLLLFPGQLEVRYHYQARVLQFLIPPLLAFCLVGLKQGWLRMHADLLSQVTSVLAVVVVYQFVWHVYATNQWNGYLAYYRQVVTTESGPIQFEGSSLDVRRSSRQAIDTMSWGWTHPLMSILVAPNNMSGMVGTKGQRWPIDPTDPSSLPRLDRFGISYARYLSNLNGERSDESR